MGSIPAKKAYFWMIVDRLGHPIRYLVCKLRHFFYILFSDLIDVDESQMNITNHKR